MKIFVFITLVIVVLTTYWLLTGAQWLSEDLVQNIPLGNIMVTVSLISLSAINLAFLAKKKSRDKFALLAMLLALAWYPAGIIWSGNLRLAFVGNGEYWFLFSYIVASTVLFAVALNLVQLLINSLSGRIDRPD